MKVILRKELIYDPLFIREIEILKDDYDEGCIFDWTSNYWFAFFIEGKTWKYRNTYSMCFSRADIKYDLKRKLMKRVNLHEITFLGVNKEISNLISQL